MSRFEAQNLLDDNLGLIDGVLKRFVHAHPYAIYTLKPTGAGEHDDQLSEWNPINYNATNDDPWALRIVPLPKNFDPLEEISALCNF